MEIKQVILQMLKPKVSAFGFNKKELMSVAAIIADNLEVEESAPQKEIEAAISEQIEAFIPVLKVGQSMANRVIDASRTPEPKEPKEPKEPNEPEPPQTPQPKEPNEPQQPTPPQPKPDEVPEWVKRLQETAEKQSEQITGFQKTIESLSGEINSMKADKALTTRKARLEELLKDTGTFGARTMKDFSRMTFATDEDFEEYISDIKTSTEDYKKELSEKGLSTMTNTPGGGKELKDKEVTDDELKEIASKF